ncbi:MAG: Methionyl-tRNA formyltransferase [Candidatus Moanabacter tarae]|uniref:methionyl-tRNA formyltransferase n=1 Tax=Candidatus Moanibacter tarae TaxID=2200854 RepID=A0A2Z4APL3_9BACT|nr:MAG: Methionyl-tRNA formyltransferase [Candidatus Moanabacter tarae]|tara:strand:+ start:21154 stop:22143 length:990 start_codon:yes stop_codon:yes gene_type:complete
MSSDPIGLPLLKYLGSANGGAMDVIGVFTNPDRATGRGMKVTENPIKKWALIKGLNLLQPAKISRNEIDWLKTSGCEILLVMAYGHILPKAVLEQPRLVTVNIHGSLLPFYRGASPIEGAIAAGETVTGVSLMRVEARLDSGPVVDQEKVAIEKSDTAPCLREKLADASVSLWERNQNLIISGRANWEEQWHDKASYTRILNKMDGQLDFFNSAKTLGDRIRALHGWPGSFIELQGSKLRIGKAVAMPRISKDPPGTLRLHSNYLTVATKEGVLRIDEMQRPGGRMLPASEFLRGFKITDGTVVTSMQMVPLFAKKPFGSKIAFTRGSE